MEDLTDRELGPYRVVAALARGGTASVYRGYQAAVDRYVAVKVLSHHLATDSRFLTRFRREARVLAQLQHPRILQVYDFGESDGYAYLVMPLVPGGTLAAALKHRQISLGTAVRLVGQICDALDYAHSKNIVHRDIKPTNILLDERQNCVVADFGLAGILEDVTRVTVTGSVMGTPAYMSPEQVAGARVGHASDIYSLGIVLYELLTGRPPFIGDTSAAVMMAHLTAVVPPPRVLSPDVPAAVETVVLKALAREPGDRFASARDFHAALVSAVRNSPPGAMSNMPPEHRWSSGADISSMFPTIASDAFLAGLVEGASASTHVAITRPGHARTLMAMVAVGTVLSGAAIGILPHTGATTPGPPPVSTPPRLPAVAVEMPSEPPTSDTLAAEQPPASHTRESVAPPPGPTVAPVRRSDQVPDDAGAAAVAPPDRAPESVSTTEVQPARLVVESPPRSRVYVDGVFRGETGVDGHLAVELPAPGAHLVRISLTGKRDVEQEIATVLGQTTRIRPALTDVTGSLRIRTSAGAEVLVDSASRGVTDANGVLFVPDIPSGAREVRVLLVNRKEFRETATVEAGRESIVEAPLEDLGPVANPPLGAGRAPSTPAGNRLLLFHFVDGSWHFGILTTSPGRIAWTETATAGYSLGQVGGILNPQLVARGLRIDNFVAGCDDVVDVGRNRAVVGEHIRLRTRNYNFAIAVENKDGQLVPKSNSEIPGLQQAIGEACPGLVR